MTVEITDSNAIGKIIDFYKEDFRKGILQPRTNELIYLDDTDIQQKIDCLNIGLFNPEVILIWGGDLAYSQLSIWAPILRRSKLKHAIFCKSLKGKEQGHAKLENVPIFGAKEGSDTKFIANYADSASAMLYMTDKNDNFGYVRAYPHLIHVAAHHGDSDKHASYNRLFGAFDYLLVADRNSMNRYLSANIQLSPDHFLTIGNSVIEGVKFEKNNQLKNILFAPTFEGHGESVNYSSLLRIKNCFNEMSDFNLMLRPHPGTGMREIQYKKVVEELNLKAVDNLKKSKMRQFNWSDILICDISGIMSEYLFTSKPIIVPVSASDGWLYHYIHNLGIKDYVYLWDYQNVSLESIILDIQNNDSLYENRIKRRNELFCGVENIEQSVGLYDRALNYLSEVKYWRDVKSIKHVSSPKNFLGTPSDSSLAEIVNGIRKGHYILKLGD